MKQNFPIYIKRDTKKAQFDTEELRKQLLYLEAYSRRENLKFAGIPKNVPEGQQMENTKELVYEILEKELKIANPRDRLNFRESTGWESRVRGVRDLLLPDS